MAGLSDYELALRLQNELNGGFGDVSVPVIVLFEYVLNNYKISFTFSSDHTYFRPRNKKKIMLQS